MKLNVVSIKIKLHNKENKMAKSKKYEFTTEPIKFVTPMAKTHFFSIAEVGEYSGKFGGTLVFDVSQLDETIKYTVGRSSKPQKGKFGEVVKKLIETAIAEYQEDTGKKAQFADKFVPVKDKDQQEIDGVVGFKVQNQEKPQVVNKERQLIKDFSEKVGNGSSVKVAVYLKPYIMNGKIGVAAYFSTVLINNLISYGGNDLDMFDDDDFENTSDDFDDVEDDDEDIEEDF